MEAVQIEQLASGTSMGEPIILSTTSERVLAASGQECGSEEAHTIPGTVNGQLEIEIPAGEARQGAIHTIQLQSPGGNTHIVEGLVVSNAAPGGAGSDGVEGPETTLFHSGSAGTFILPTSHGSCNSLANTALITSPSGGGACEVITADPSDHHILSGLQVVRVTTGENCETIFLVPSSAAGKDGMQPVMVLQPAEDMSEEHGQGAEVVEEAVELNIPSPKPILTTVKQEADGAGERTIVVNDGGRHYEASNAPTTLVVVSGDRTNGAVARPGVSHSEPVDKKPVLSAVTTVNGHASNSKTPSSNTPAVITPSISDDRPKRKAAIKATATRKAVIASLTSPRKQSHSSPRSPRKQNKNAQNTPASQDSKAGTSASNSKQPTVQVVATTPARPSAVTLASTSFVTTPVIPSVTPQPRVIMAGGTQIQATPRSVFLLPEDIVSESDDDGEGPPIRTCVVCVRRRRFTEGIFEVTRPEDGNVLNSSLKPQLLPNMEMLIAHLNITINYQALGRPHELGICTNCLDSLQRWHVFASAIQKRHEAVRSSGGSHDDGPVNWEPFETRIYRNYRKMAKVKEVFNAATHGHLTRRDLTEKDWDFFCDHLFRSNSLKSEKARELERYIMSREKLTHLYCVKCQRLVKNGRKGYVKHMRTQHPHDNVLLPCDICGNHFPDKNGPPNTEEYYAHWISHFYFNSCDDCGKRFPTKRALGQHKQTVHKNRPNQWNRNGSSGEDRPWKCDQCDASFKMKGALVSHRDVVHFNRKNHVCNMCGEAFKSASSLRGHVRRHEGRRDYKCEVCQKEYYTYSALKGHKVVHQTARDFICGICGKAFKKKKALEEHGTLHTGVKPHRCPICGREIRVKSNLYKHMKIHKKNAELGITSARGRHPVTTATATSSSSSSSSFALASASTSASVSVPPTTKPTPTRNKPKAKNESKVKIVKVERPVNIKEEPVEYSSTFHQSTPTTSSTVKMATNSSPVQGATAVDVVLENAELAGGEHRGPIVVSIVTEGVGGGPANILHMNPDQQAQLLNVVTSLANSQGQSVTVAGPGGATFLASPLHATVSSAGASTSRNNLVVTSASGSERGEQILAVPTTQYYTAQQFFGSLDHLQN